jgi:Tfp pilus assembly PilM family ATPase
MPLMSFGKLGSGGSGVPSPVAIDFGVGSLKLLQVTTGTPCGLVAAACVPTPEALLDDTAKRYEFQFAALPKLVRSVGFKGKRAVCAIPAAQTFIKHMQFPKVDGVELAALVEGAVPAALGCAQDALVYRHYVVPGATPGQTGAARGTTTTGGKQEVICLAASREFIGRIMDAIRAAKLEPVGMHPECVAALRAFDGIMRREEDKHVATLYLDIGTGMTKAWMAHGRDLVFAKTIQLGGLDMDKAVAAALECEIPAARNRRLSASLLTAMSPVRPIYRGLTGPSGSARPGAKSATNADGTQVEPASEPAQVAAEDRRTELPTPGLSGILQEMPTPEASNLEFDIGDCLEVLTDEIAMCLRYYESLFPGRRTDRVVFFGGESRHQGLCQHVARKLRVAAHAADPLSRVARAGGEPCQGVDLSRQQPGWTVPFGLAVCPTDL